MGVRNWLINIKYGINLEYMNYMSLDLKVLHKMVLNKFIKVRLGL